jgi:hypothetical protein
MPTAAAIETSAFCEEHVFTYLALRFVGCASPPFP